MNSEERIMLDHNTERNVIRTRGARTMRAQPRKFIATPILMRGKWTGSDMRKIRREHGVGRPRKDSSVVS